MSLHERLLSYAPSNPTTDFPEYCEAWRIATNADWVWLWTYNDVTSHWELSAADTGFDASRLQSQPPQSPDTTSVAEYVVRTGRPEFVGDLVGWRKKLKGTEFKVGAARRLMELGCTAFCTVPLIAPKLEERVELFDDALPIRAAICSHYVDQSRWPRIPADSLLLMGRLVGSLIRNSYHAEHREILVKLNALADKHLTSVQRRHGAARRDYLHSLIRLIKQTLPVRAVSFFYQVPFENQIECLATTGLAKATASNVITKCELSEITYNAGEGLTGRCFATGDALVRVRNASTVHQPKYIEVIDKELARNAGTCFCPIPRARNERSEDAGPYAQGVIRCTDPFSTMFGKGAQSFSSVAIKKLAFISRQIAPILHSFALRVQRDYAISIVKHDLETPLNMICDTADDIETYVDTKQGVKWHDLMNLKTSAMFAQNLVDQLDPDPFQVPDLEIDQTLLESDIVARVRHMLEHYARKENDIVIQYSMFVTPNSRVPAMYLDRALIERAFWNLLINAIKYGARGSMVTVKASIEDSDVVVDISNVGMGVKESDKDKIFLPSFRSTEARRKRQGLGLGLPIAKRAMEKHGGKLLLVRLANPTVFRMKFPRHLLLPEWNREA